MLIRLLTMTVLVYSVTRKTSNQSHSWMRNQSISRWQKWLIWEVRILTRWMIRLQKIIWKEQGKVTTLHLRMKIRRKLTPLQQLRRIGEEKVRQWMSNSWPKTVRDRLRVNSSKTSTRNRPWHKSIPKTLTKITIASEMLEHRTPPWCKTLTPTIPICSIVNS